MGVVVRLNSDPEREVAIPLVLTHRGGATAADYSGVPEAVRFGPGVTANQFDFSATDDSEDDSGESVVVGFGALPPRVSGSGGATVEILDEDTPPRAEFKVDGVACDDELCRTRTGVPVGVVDMSTGPTLIRQWDFGDGLESSLPTLDHAWSEPGFYEVSLWVSDGVRESSRSRTFLVEAAEPQGACVADGETRCLQDSRYAVVVEWRNADGESGPGTVVRTGTNDSGLFWFFNRDNWEILIKVLDGCALNGNIWVFGASTTDLGYRIEVTDTVTGVVREYENEPGRAAPAITDATAFQACAR